MQLFLHIMQPVDPQIIYNHDLIRYLMNVFLTSGDSLNTG